MLTYVDAAYVYGNGSLFDAPLFDWADLLPTSVCTNGLRGAFAPPDRLGADIVACLHNQDSGRNATDGTVELRPHGLRLTGS